MIDNTSPMRWLLAVAAAIVLTACASIGRPEGGPRDMEPPRVVRSIPADGSVNFTGGQISIYFDENVQLEDAMSKVVVSPPQPQPPVVSANGRRLKVELRDTLADSTTYTIDFADAIRDLNESNILDGYAMSFSTGPTIDTLAISGMVFEARNLEPAQGMVVGVYAEPMADTTLTTRPLERVTKTNQLGRFTIRGLKPGNYRIFAINDLNRDYHWDRSEDVAFYDVALSPSTEPVTLTDTLTGIDGSDSIAVRNAIRYLPDDVLLTWFNENYIPAYLVKHERPERRKLSMIFSQPNDSLPELSLADGVRRGVSFHDVAVVDANARLDSLTYWITDSLVAAADTITLAARYLKTDSLDRLVMTTDTLTFALRGAKKRKADKPKSDNDTVSATVEYVNFALDSPSSQDLNVGMLFRSATPVAGIDTAGVHFEMMVDTLWTAVESPKLVRISPYNPREFRSDYNWNPSTRYRMSVDSAAITDIYGNVNKPLNFELNTKAVEDYASLYFNIVGLDSLVAVVELLRSDEPIRTATVVDGSATLDFLTPGTFYARLYIDRNRNGQWDTGSVADSIQPEDVFYYPRKISLKKNWDIEQTWDIYATPVDLQKPEEIKTNKPKKGKWEERQDDRNAEDETDELWDTYSRDPFFNNNNIDNFERRRH